jgi:hypothetical protein
LDTPVIPEAAAKGNNIVGRNLEPDIVCGKTKSLTRTIPARCVTENTLAPVSSNDVNDEIFWAKYLDRSAGRFNTRLDQHDEMQSKEQNDTNQFDIKHIGAICTSTAYSPSLVSKWS